MTREELNALEQLNELQLTDTEAVKALNIFADMRRREDALGQYPTDDVEPMVHVMPLENVLREDVQEQPFTRESLLEGAPEHTADSWQVPRLVR